MTTAIRIVCGNCGRRLAQVQQDQEAVAPFRTTCAKCGRKHSVLPGRMNAAIERKRTCGLNVIILGEGPTAFARNGGPDL